MPAPVAAAAVTAAATLAGGYLSGRGSSNAARSQERSSREATRAQERAANEALAFEREKKAAEEVRYERAVAEYKQQWDAWNSARMGLMRRYGINAPAGGQAPGPGGAGAAATARPTLGTFASGISPAITQPTPIGGPPELTPAEAPLPTLDNLGNWNDWNRYQVRP